MKVESARKLLDSIAALQSCYITKIITVDEKTSTLILSCDIKLNLKAKDAIKLETEFKDIISNMLTPHIDQQLKDLQSEVSK